MTALPLFSAIPVPETTVGIAFETERGTPEAPEFWLPIMGPKYKPDLQLLPDEGLRGSMVTLYDEVPGLRFDSHAWDSYPYMDTLPLFFKALLGSTDTLTVAPTTTALEIEAKAGETKIETETPIAAGSYLVLGSGAGTQETVFVKEATGEKLTLAYPLAFTHKIPTVVLGLTKHEFSLLNNSPTTGNQPLSCTLTDFAGETNWRQLAAAQLNSINMSGSADALPKMAVDWFANAAIAPTPPSPSFSTAEAPPGWTVTAAIGGTQVAYLVSWEFDLKRNVKNVPAITGTQAYYQHYAGALEATAKVVLLEDPSATWLTAYEEGTLESLDLTLSDVQNGWVCNLHSTKMKFTTGELDRSKEWVEVPLEVQLIPSTTDALAGGVSPIKATVANAHTTVY